MELSKILRGIKLRAKIKEMEIKKIAYSSNDCDAASLFVAIKGNRRDGHDFANKAYEKGARAFIAQKKLNVPKSAQVITVSDSRRALSIASANFYGHPSRNMKVFGVIGTNGKTTTTFLLESILESAGFNSGVIGTINYRYAGKVLPATNTTPESLDIQKMMNDMQGVGVNALVMEASSHALHQGRTGKIYFDGGIFTNLTQDHLDYHLSMRNYFLSKRRFFSRSLKESSRHKNIVAAINVDDKYGQLLFDEFKDTYKLIPFSLKKCGGVYPTDVKSSVNGINLLIHTPSGDLKINTLLTGEFNIYNILGAVALSMGHGIDLDVIKSGVERVKNIPGRMHKINTKAGTIFIDYAHTPDALYRVIKAVRELEPDVKRVITLFGCGGERDKKKRKIMGEIARDMSDISIITSDNPRSEEPIDIINDVLKPFHNSGIKEIDGSSSAKKGYLCYVDREVAIEKAISIMKSGDAVILAGKGHENYQVVKDKNLPFNDVKVAEKYLTKKGLKIIY